MNASKPPKMTKAQAGQLGGLATSRKYGHAYMIALARKGGERYNQKYVAGGLSGIDTGRPYKDD